MWLYNCLVRSFVVTSLTYISARTDGSWKIDVHCSGRWIAKYAINSILCHQHIPCVACMLVLPQMCLVSSAGDENECGQGAAHTAPISEERSHPAVSQIQWRWNWRVIWLTLVDEPILQQQRSLVNLFITSLKFELKLSQSSLIKTFLK